MHIGIWNYLSTAYAIDPAVLAKRAEELGFDSLWLPEHPIMPVEVSTPFPLGGPIPAFYGEWIDPLIGLARASAVTRTLKLGTGICLVPERNPLLLAKEIATLDVLSGGRVCFGVGAGWLKEETAIMGGDVARPWTQTGEAVMVLKTLWSQDAAEYHGRYYDFPAVQSVPKPVQTPHPPILLGTITATPQVFQRIVTWGDGWLPLGLSLEQLTRGRQTLNEVATAAGRDPTSLQIVAVAPPDLAALAAYADAGVDGVLLALHTAGEQAVLATLEALARQVLV